MYPDTPTFNPQLELMAACQTHAWSQSHRRTPKFIAELMIALGTPKLAKIDKTCATDELAKLFSLVETAEWILASRDFTPSINQQCADCQYTAACESWRRNWSRESPS